MSQTILDEAFWPEERMGPWIITREFNAWQSLHKMQKQRIFLCILHISFLSLISEVYPASLHFLNILPICYILGFFFSLSYYTAYNSPLILNFPGPMSGHLLVLLLDALYNSGAKKVSLTIPFIILCYASPV